MNRISTQNLNTLVKKFIIFFIGLFIIQIGVSIFLTLGIGSDPFTVFSQGVANLLHISIGNANRILTLILLIIIFFSDRKNINIGTLLAVIFTGSFLNFTNSIIIQWLPSDLSLFFKILLFAVACVIIGIGFPTLFSARLGVPPNDLVYLAISDGIKKPYSIVRMSTDSLFLLLGLLTGGVIGIGTIICILLLGPVVQFFMNPITNTVSKYILKENKIDSATIVKEA